MIYTHMTLTSISVIRQIQFQNKSVAFAKTISNQICLLLVHTRCQNNPRALSVHSKQVLMQFMCFNYVLVLEKDYELPLETCRQLIFGEDVSFFHLAIFLLCLLYTFMLLFESLE